MSRRALSVVAAVAGAALLVALAVDVLRWDRALAADDLRFRASPAAAQGLWQPDVLLPFGATRRALGLDDDLAHRGALRRFWPVRPGQVVSGPELEAQRGQVQAELGRISRLDPDDRRRSRAMNMLGVLTVGAYYTSYYGFGAVGPGDPNERASVLRNAIGLFQNAVVTDPGNAEAKQNLELLLRDAGAAEIVVDDPSGQAAEGESAGAGLRAGSGY